MIENEHYFVVEAWDEQFGGWADVDEARSFNQAHNMIAQIRASDVNNQGRIYSIREHTRTIDKPWKKHA